MKIKEWLDLPEWAGIDYLKSNQFTEEDWRIYFHEKEKAKQVFRVLEEGEVYADTAAELTGINAYLKVRI